MKFNTTGCVRVNKYNDIIAKAHMTRQNPPRKAKDWLLRQGPIRANAMQPPSLAIALLRASDKEKHGVRLFFTLYV